MVQLLKDILEQLCQDVFTYCRLYSVSGFPPAELMGGTVIRISALGQRRITVRLPEGDNR